MRLRIHSALLLALVVAASTPFTAHADEIGGTGFDVPQAQADEWLWGIEGLVRTPVDLSVDLGVAFYGWEIEGEAQHDDGTDPGDFVRVDNRLDIETQAFEGGFRIAGGIGYWSCCVLIEPALSFRLNRPFGDDRTDDTPRVVDPSEPSQVTFAEAEIKHGWELALGPQMTWLIRDDTPFVGRYLGGLPLVFFPFLGVAEANWDVEIPFFASGVGNPPGTIIDREFEDQLFMVGFDLDFPLPGSRADFTHALTFGFRWVESEEQHDMGPFPGQVLAGGGSGTSSGFCGDGTGSSGSGERNCYQFEGADGWRVGLYYRVTWNDFEGFFKRNIFGPAE